MRIERRFTKAGKSPYEDIEFRESGERNPQSGRLHGVRARAIQVPAHWSQVAADILAQKYFRKAGVPASLRKSRRRPCRPGCGARSPTMPRWRRCPRRSASAARRMPARSSTGSPAPGPIGAGRAAISPPRRTPTPSSTSSATCSPCRWRRPNSPQWFNTGLHWAYGIDGPSQGHYYVDSETGELTRLDLGLRASAAARLLHPVDRGRSRQRGRHHGSVGPRGAAVQIRLRHRLRISPGCAARTSRCPAGASPPA